MIGTKFGRLTTGYFIRKRQWHTYCLVMGGIETIFTPFGTVLGAFTIVVLTKPSIKALFTGKEVLRQKTA
jgi:hypothetical protein